MKELDLINFSVLPVQIIIGVLIVLMAIYGLLKLVKRYLFVLVKSEKWNDKIGKSWPRIEISMWIITTASLLIFLLNQSFLVTMVMLVLILVVGGKSWRDLINGVFIKFENRISEGDFISNIDYSGVVNQMGNRGLQIKIDGGELAFIPYRNLGGYKIRKVDRTVNSEMISVLVKVNANFAVDAAIKKLKKAVLQIPYTMITHP
ncbi:MAG: mechanosensitive ion channel domain-containing protein, partial [Salibacteraceae bacterium]